MSSTDYEKTPVDVTEKLAETEAETEPYIVFDCAQKRLITFVATIVASCKLPSVWSLG